MPKSSSNPTRYLTVDFDVWFAEAPLELRETVRLGSKMASQLNTVRAPSGIQGWVPSHSGPRLKDLGSRCVEVRPFADPVRICRYTPSARTADETTAGPLMEIDPDIPPAELLTAFVHECFHLFHGETLHERRENDPRILYRYEVALEAIRRTSAYAKLRLSADRASVRVEVLEKRAGVTPEVLERSRMVAAWLGHLATDEEWAARAYSQRVYNRYRRFKRVTDHVSKMAKPTSLDYQIFLSDQDTSRFGTALGRLFQTMGCMTRKKRKGK